MVQANELRIGNYIQVGNNPPIKATTEILYGIGIDEFYQRKTIPISLTPEILEKCGFKKDYTGFALDDKMSLSIAITSDGEFLPCWLDKALFPSATRVIKYLHQLQNLYFALTGEELKIDL